MGKRGKREGEGEGGGALRGVGVSTLKYKAFSLTVYIRLSIDCNKDNTIR